MSVLRLTRRLYRHRQEFVSWSSLALGSNPLSEQSLSSAVGAGGESGTLRGEHADTPILVLSAAPSVHVVPSSSHVVVGLSEVIPEALVGALSGGEERLRAGGWSGELSHGVEGRAGVCQGARTLGYAAAVDPLGGLLVKVVQRAEPTFPYHVLVTPLMHE